MSESAKESIKVTCQTPIGSDTSYQSLGVLLEAADTSLTRREKVHALKGQMELYEWTGHIMDINLRAHINLKKHKFDHRAVIDSKKHR